MTDAEPNPYAPPETPAEQANSGASLRTLAWCSLLLPYAILPLLMLLPQWLPSGSWWGLLGFILVLPYVSIGISAGIGGVCAEVFELIPNRHSVWLAGFYLVTLFFEYATLFDTISPNFSWK